MPVYWTSVLFTWGMFILYPLYVRHGYIGIDKTKNTFLWDLLLVFFILSVLGMIVQAAVHMIPSQARSKLSEADIGAGFYFLTVLVSVGFSIDRDTALFGQSGWFMGACLLGMMCYVYFVISRFWLGDRIWIPGLLISSGCVFLLGVLNRFSIWPIPMSGSYANGFLSTLGNIGWYSGFIAVISPIGIGLYIINEKGKWYEQVLLAIYSYMVFLTCLSQGADSIFLFFLVVFSGTLVISCEYTNGLYRWLELCQLWALAGITLYFLRHINYEWYTYDSVNLCNVFNNTKLSFVVFALFSGIYVFLRKIRFRTEECKWYKRIIKKLPYIFLGCVLLWLAAAIINTLYMNRFADIDINPADEHMLKKLLQKFLYFSPEWGSSRGSTISIGIQCFRKLTLGRKLIGVGPDCFAVFLYGNQELSAYASNWYDGYILTNAHNEVVTSLVNVGIVGTIAFYGMLAGFIYRCVRNWKRDARVLLIVLSILCYIGFNVFNYAQIFNYPYIFLLMGIGEAWMKQAELQET